MEQGAEIVKTSWVDVAQTAIELLLGRNTNFWLITTVLLIICIGVSQGRKILCNHTIDKNCKGDNENQCEKLTRKDYVYLIVISTIGAVFLLSLALHTDENAVSLFSFASTLTSIILSVVAIILTIKSEASSESTKEKLGKAADQIEEMTESLEKAAKNIDNERLKDIGEKIDKLSKSMEDAINKLEMLREETREAREQGTLAKKNINFFDGNVRETSVRYNNTRKGDIDA